MKKQVPAFFLAIVILVGIVAQSASARTINDGFDLTFNGTTATCTFSVTKVGTNIEVTMSLWQGGQQVQSWTETGNGVVYMSEQCTVSKGKSYTLKVSYTFNGTSMPAQSITKTS